ncbi:MULTISPECIES: O-antigen ligase [Listeria]|uniref:O-antigen ligase family protein n=1 Tax=Listeria TaxID=1637 RepID=UPI000B590A4B|nr:MULTISPECIES: O-antigen ligase family protein [Listeria]
MLTTNLWKNKFHLMLLLFIIAAIVILEICIFMPYGYLISLLFLLVIPVVFKINYDKITNVLSFVILFAGFFGSYLGIPGSENIFLFRLLIPVHFILFCVTQKKDWQRLKYVKWFFIAFVLFLSGMTITLFWTPDMSLSIRYLYFTFEWLYVIFLCVYYINDTKRFHLFSNLLTIVYIGILGLGIFEVLTGIHLSRSGSYYYETTTSQFQPTGFLLNTNDFASEITILLPFVIFTLTRIKMSWLRITSIVLVSSLALYLVIMTYSRLSMVIILAELFIFLLAWSKVWSLISIYVGLMAGMLLLTFSRSDFISKIISIISKAFNEKGGSTSDRMEMYKLSWKLIKESKFNGMGAGILPVKLDYYMYGYERWEDNYFSAHNYWLEALANGGLLTFIPLLIFFGLILFYGVKYILENGFNLVGIVVLLVLMSFFSASIGLSNSIDKRHLSLGIGLAISMLNIYYFNKGESDFGTS